MAQQQSGQRHSGVLDSAFEFVVGRHNGARPSDWRVRLLLATLAHLSRVYGAVVRVRLALYRVGILRHHTLGCQVISVGNLTVGGTGKTPVVEIIARDLAREGRKVAILSRGYKKKEPPPLRKLLDRMVWKDRWTPPRVVSDGESVLLDSEMSGDEPYMLAAHLPGVVVLVDRDRVKSGRYAIRKFGCDTLILDDGFQYLHLRHRVEIVLVDRTNPFGNGHVLPRGILREPAASLRKAGYIFITKCDGESNEELKARLRGLNPKAEIIECTHKPRYFQNAYTGERKPLEFIRGQPVVALSGIAAPEGFERAIDDLGADVLDRKRFRDHHRYSGEEILSVIAYSRRLGAAAVVTTEKDAVRMPRLDRADVPVYFLRVDIQLLSGTEDFDACISRICFKQAAVQ